MTRDIDHEGTRNIVCPYCGYEHHDSWECSDSADDNYQCHQCGEEFGYERDVSVYYTSWKRKVDGTKPD